MGEPEVTERNQPIVDEFRARGGVVGGSFEGIPLLLLTHTGARTGHRRTSPVVYLDDGDHVLIFAGNGGSDRHPAWYHNILADPRVTVELGTETYEAKAVPLTGEQRDERYARALAQFPALADLQERTARRIPLVALWRA
ncbi:MAG TPA: nitroreductase family deazaflavin-dependent oxidoreductase [Amycolatopsis sp.]|jgi:deazaflavin-dependent oxidoreductase (nitroreductase family)|nr:nitroreductase family deazaflavin-dependent oxidoreductase [Amycolatopsis sp.]